jgi:2-C-methyl-D-erythritol 4-phosphate cytidylyltransferase
VTDTLKCVRDGLIVETVSRDGLWAAQTPQVFRRGLLESALEYARVEHLDVTDEASLFERMGLPVAIVNSSTSNLKITVPEDLALAAALIAGRVG